MCVRPHTHTRAPRPFPLPPRLPPPLVSPLPRATQRHKSSNSAFPLRVTARWRSRRRSRCAHADAGAKISEIDLCMLFESSATYMTDRFRLFSRMHRRQRDLHHLKYAMTHERQPQSRRRRKSRRSRDVAGSDLSDSDSGPLTASHTSLGQGEQSPTRSSIGGKSPRWSQHSGSFNLGRPSSASSTTGERPRSAADARRAVADTRMSLPETTPWHEHHVYELREYIRGFERYAKRQIVVNAFDLMCWGICGGAVDFVQMMWKRSVSPLRAALIGKQMCAILRKSVSDKSSDLDELEQWFETTAVGVLEQLPDQESARKLLLTAEAEHCDLGSKDPQTNLLEVAVELDHKKFIAHRYCIGVVNEMWHGRSPQCGRVRLKERHHQHVGRWRSIGMVIVQLALPFLAVVKTEVNDLYKWPSVAPSRRGHLARPAAADPEPAKVIEVIVRISRLQHRISIVHIPYVKFVGQFVSRFLFAVLFVVVAFQPICQGMNATHLALLGWVVAKAVDILFFVRTKPKRLIWTYNRFHLLEVASVGLLGLLFFPLAFAARQGNPFAPFSGQFTTIAEDVDAIAFFDRHLDGMARAQHLRGTEGMGEVQKDITQCGWTGMAELQLTLLAAAALPIVVQISEVFTISKQIGKLMICAYRMGRHSLSAWLPILVVVATAFGIAQNLLLPHFQSEHGAGAITPLPTHFPLFDVSAAGPFWAPFWASFGYFHPGELSGAPGGALFAPLFIWLYLLLVLVLFLNLLIAMFNDQFRQVMRHAEEEWSMNFLKRTMVYLVQYPMPAPLNLLYLPYDVCVSMCSWRADRQAAAATPNGAQGGDAYGGASHPSGSLNSFREALWGHPSPDWRDPVFKKQGTRRYLMERAETLRPFQCDTLVFSRAEASAMEGAAREKHLSSTKVMSERSAFTAEAAEMRASDQMAALQSRLDLIEGKLNFIAAEARQPRAHSAPYSRVGEPPTSATEPAAAAKLSGALEHPQVCHALDQLLKVAARLESQATHLERRRERATDYMPSSALLAPLPLLPKPPPAAQPPPPPPPAGTLARLPSAPPPLPRPLPLQRRAPRSLHFDEGLRYGATAPQGPNGQLPQSPPQYQPPPRAPSQMRAQQLGRSDPARRGDEWGHMQPLV